MNQSLRNIQLFLVITLLSGCVTTTYYTPPIDATPQARIRFLAADNISYAVTMYEDALCTKGLHSGFMGGPGYDLSGLPHSIPQPVKVYGNTLSMSDIPSLPPLSFIERSVPAGKELVFVINRGFDHNITQGVGYSTISMKSCNTTIAFTPKVGEQYEVGFSVDADRCKLSAEELLLDSKGESIRAPVSTFRSLGQQCSVYTNP